MRGLTNPTYSTCYVNSAIQFLFHSSPDLTRFFRDNVYEGDCKITKEYQKLSNALLELGQEDNPVDTSLFLDALFQKFKVFHVGEQGDASEVFVFLIDTFESSIGKEFIHDIFSGVLEQVTTYHKDSDVDKYAPPAPTSDLYRESRRIEIFTTLCMLVTEPTGLEDLVKEYLQPESFEGYKDDEEVVHALAVKFNVIKRWPRATVFVFSQPFHKFNTQIPLEWEGRKLVAAVLHRGTIRNGHYALVVLVRDHWYMKSDEMVVKSEDKIEDFVGEISMAVYR